jgi:cold shock CspA family protein
MKIVTHCRKWFDTRGFGFLADPRGRKDIFARKEDIISRQTFKRLLPNSRVECEVIETERGQQAINIRPI